MEEQEFINSIAAFKIPENGKPLFQLGDIIFEWDEEKTQIVIGELSRDLYFELFAQTSEVTKAADAGLLEDYNDAGDVSIKFSLTKIFDHYIPTGSSDFYDGKSKDHQYFYLDGTVYSLQFSGTVTCDKGWVGINGYLKASYEDEPVFTLKIYQKINTENLHWENYHFLSLEETATAEPKIVRHLTIKNPSFETLPEEVFNFINLETLTILNHSPYFEQSDKLPLKNLGEPIGELVSLKSIQINNAQIASVPKSLGQLKNLEFLGFNLCNITDIPLEVWQLSNLNSLYLQQNRITEIPEEVHLEKLLYLDVSGNPLKTLPVGLLKSQNLARITAYDCTFEYLPQEFSHIKGLDLDFETKKKVFDFSYKNPDGTPTIEWNDELYFAEKEPIFFHQLIKEHGLEKYANELKNIIKKGICFELTDEDAAKIGVHRFGGKPDLPLAIDYPKYYSTYREETYHYEFLAQINCEAVAHLQEFLPKKGMLFFFLSTFHDFGSDTEYPIGKVIYVEDLSQLASGARFNFKEEDFFELMNGQYEPKIADAFEKFSLPAFYDIETNAFQFEKKAPSVIANADLFFDQIDFEKAFDDQAETDHGINTSVFTQHENPELQAASAKKGNPEDWMVLLQLKSRGEFQWGDAGDLFFVIHKSDLAQKKFNNVYVGLESS